MSFGIGRKRVNIFAPEGERWVLCGECGHDTRVRRDGALTGHISPENAAHTRCPGSFGPPPSEEPVSGLVIPDSAPTKRSRSRRKR